VAKIFFDTNVFIHLFEDNPVFTPPARLLRERMISAQSTLVTSTMTLGELLTGPHKSGNTLLAQKYGTAIQKTATVIPFDENAANIYSRIRAEYRISQPDAIQLACAATHGVELFITNDERLQRIRVAGIHFIVPMETALTLVR
jgi:predicted nucleic acid-binding protein